ncbi:MAG: hypothetical protein HFI09_04260 [Bacilli bacterium]|nr:hypothetical protein [Bacilli bacterium]
MKESFWGYWIIVLGIFVIIIMMLISSVTTSNTQDYYMVKDVTEAAMVDAIDYSYYRQYQELRINREKFVENFLRRFAENVSLNTYTIDFYDLYEAPPKVSVKVTTKSGTFSVMGDATSFDIVNKVDSILETSGTAGSTGRENNSSITSDGTVSTSRGIGLNGSGSTVSSSNSGSNVPSTNALESMTKESWFKSKYYSNSKIKDEYLNDPERFRNEVLSDYQSKNNVSFSNSEENQFFKNLGNIFQWAIDDYDFDDYDYDNDWENDENGDDYEGSESGGLLDFSDAQIKNSITKFVNRDPYSYYDCGGTRCRLISFSQFYEFAKDEFEGDYDMNFDSFESSYFRDLCEQVYASLPKTRTLR